MDCARIFACPGYVVAESGHQTFLRRPSVILVALSRALSWSRPLLMLRMQNRRAALSWKGLLLHRRARQQQHASSMAARRLLHLSTRLAARPKADMPSELCHVACAWARQCLQRQQRPVLDVPSWACGSEAKDSRRGHKRGHKGARNGCMCTFAYGVVAHSRRLCILEGEVGYM